MTREEAITRYNAIKARGDFCEYLNKEMVEMAIQALSQEPRELLIIKSNILLHQDDRKKWAESIKREKESGVIILPPYFEPLLVPADIEINTEQEPCDDAISRDFQIGDEVRIIGSDPIYDDCDVGWVIRNASEKVKTMYVMRNDGSADEEAKAEWYRTGRHNDTLAEVIRALPSVTQKWIPVSERLPEDLEPVNITWVNHNPERYYEEFKDKPFTATGHYYKGRWYWYSCTCQDYLEEYGRCDFDEIDTDIEVIAWMPLPEPYDPQESEDKE